MDRNVILALVLSMAVFIGYDLLILEPQRREYQAYQEAQKAAAAEQAAVQAALPDADRLPELIADPNREQALTRAPGRLPIETGELRGSINLQGLVFDDLILTDYKVSLEEDADDVVLLSPASAPHAQYMRTGGRIGAERDEAVIWNAPQGAVLSEDTPVTLTRNENGIEHVVTISVDNHFMFTIEQTVRNRSSEDVTFQLYGETRQKGIPPDLKNMMILFEGPLGVVGKELFDKKYKKMVGHADITQRGTSGWVGLTDKFWLSAAIPPQDKSFLATLSATNDAIPLFRSRYELGQEAVPAGMQITRTSHLYGGAKEVDILREYQRELNISRFDWAVDWGNFSFLTRPIFNTLSFFHGLSGNWGVAILLLTLVIKAFLFPLANLSYKSMAGMKKVQPELKKVQERYKDDKMKQQQEMMALYKKHKINPAAGCLPILAQMPIFYALYKTLFVTLELRHEGFLYIRDLSEQDPTNIFNLFGLLPYDPTLIPLIGPFLGLGILPLLMGAAMFVQTKLNPPPPDPTQRMIFGLMPLIFMFIFAPFAAGLVLYWFWNTFLSVIQQYVIMKRQGADVDILGNIKESFGKKQAAANENKAK